MSAVTRDFVISTQGNNDVIDLTPTVRTFFDDIFNEIDHDADHQPARLSGTLTIFTPHTTAGITALEYEAGANRDLGEICSRLVPEDIDYHHNAADTNGHAHARSALMGPSIQVPVSDGRPMLGTWQTIALIDFDDHPRNRSVIVQLVY